jgi:26S proteasome regulatory subunit N9
MDLEAIPDFLAEKRDEAPADVQHIFLQLEDEWDRKLWHQLTDTVLQYFQTDDSASQRLAIYKAFILSFADKISQLKLVQLALSASTQCKGAADNKLAAAEYADSFL